MTRRIAEPVRRHAVALAQHLPRGRHLIVELRGAERDQVGVADALRVELPAGGDEPADLASVSPPCDGGRPVSCMFSIADPAEPLSTGSAFVYCEW